MAYMNADTNAKVGYRPYLQTNPRRAAMLSGIQNITGLGQNFPFDPWRLHGLGELGQNRPFDQDSGGWLLHGLSGVMDLDPANASDQATASAISSLQQLVGQGLLTPDEADAVFAGNLSLNDALNQAASRAPGPVTSVQSPAGSRLVYTASYTSGVADPLRALTPSGVIGRLTQLLSGYGMHITGSDSSAGPVHGSITVNISDDVGHQLLSDAQGVLDNLMRQIVGASNFGGGQLSIVGAPGQPLPPSSTSPPGAGTDALSWVEGNAGMIAAVLIAIVAIPTLGKIAGRR